MKNRVQLKNALTGLCAAFVLTCASVNAQVNSYLFSKSNGTYTAITGATALGDTMNNEQVFLDPNKLAGDTIIRTGPGLPIGFTFMFNGVACDKFGVSTNGWIAVGTGTINMNSIPGNAPLTDSLAPGTSGNFISALGYDMMGRLGCSLSYALSGVSGSQVLTIQWSDYQRVFTFPGFGQFKFGDHINVQIQLHEGTNSIDIVYGNFTPGQFGVGVQVGLRGTDMNDYNNRTSTTSWDTSKAGTDPGATMALSATVAPANGLTYTWTPAPPCSGSNGGTTIASKDAACAQTEAVVLSLSGASSGAGLSYQWQASADGVNWVDISGGTSPGITVGIPDSTYFRCKVSCSGTDGYSSVKLIKLKSFYECYCNTNLHSTACAPTTNSINKVEIKGTSLLNASNGCTGANGNSYTAYSASQFTTTLNRSKAYTFALTTKDTAKYAYWIDYDQNGVFDDYEMINDGKDSLTLPNKADTVRFTIPKDAVLGLTGMRVRDRAYKSILSAAMACTRLGSGETEDYVITIGDVVSGVSEKNGISAFSIYPNPTNNLLNINFSTGRTSNLSIRLTSINGQLVYEETVGRFEGQFQKQLSTKDLCSGIYFLQVTTDHGVSTQKVVKN